MHYIVVGFERRLVCVSIFRNKCEFLNYVSVDAVIRALFLILMKYDQIILLPLVTC